MNSCKCMNPYLPTSKDLEAFSLSRLLIKSCECRFSYWDSLNIWKRLTVTRCSGRVSLVFFFFFFFFFVAIIIIYTRTHTHTRKEREREREREREKKFVTFIREFLYGIKSTCSQSFSLYNWNRSHLASVICFAFLIRLLPLKYNIYVIVYEIFKEYVDGDDEHFVTIWN